MVQDVVDDFTFTENSGNSSSDSECPATYTLAKELDIQETVSGLHLLYAILYIEDVSSLKLYKSDQDIDEETRPKFDFILRRKDCLLRSDDSYLSFTIQVQDVNCRFRTKQV